MANHPHPEAAPPSDSAPAGDWDRDLFPHVYEQLRNLARRKMSREAPGLTLQPTALVHEAYLRLGGPSRFENRRHFVGAAAEAMRRILVERARKRRLPVGRPDDASPEPELVDVEIATPDSVDVLALNQALSDLERIDPRKGVIVKLRFFAGLTIDETARVLEVTKRTINRDWTAAKAWLHNKMNRE